MNFSPQHVAAALGGEVSGREVLAPGPNHSAKDRSLSIKLDAAAPDGFVVHSFAGDDPLACKDHVRGKLGIVWTQSKRDIPPSPSKAAEYVYQIEDGTPYLRVRRTADKKFFQQHWTGSAWENGAPTGPKIPYRLPELLQAEHDSVLIVEGEKDADTLAAKGFVATTNAGGAEKWHPDLDQYFAGRDVYILPDNDEPGTRHAKQVSERLGLIAREIHVINLPDLPPKGDVSDWFGAGGSASELVNLMLRAAEKINSQSEFNSCVPAIAPGYPFKTFDEMAAESPAKRWLIKGVMARGESSAWIAPPGGLKSALMAQASICVAAGLDWNGKSSKEVAAVVYFAIERADLVRRRLRAHGLRMNLKGLPIAVVSSTIDLTKPDAFKKVVDTISEVERRFGVRVGLVIIDTFAKLIAAGGGDENSAKDQGAVFANVQRVKNATDSHVALIGHTGKDESKGSRGSNAILGDVDLMVTISGDMIRTATVTKANDAPEGPLFSFTSEVHEFGLDEDGDPVTVNIVSSAEVSVQSAPKLRDRWPKGLKLVHDAITGALLDAGRQHQVNGDGPMVMAASVSAARSIHNQRFVSSGDGDRDAAERQAWKRNFAKARQSDLIGAETSSGEELVWLVTT